MTNERTIGQINPSERPNPYAGVALEVFKDILTNREAFRSKVMRQMASENEVLHDFVLKASMGSPNRELTLDWCLIYYEIFSRSARKEGEPMIKVTKETHDSMFQKEVTLLNMMTRGRPEAESERLLEQYRKKKEEDIENRKSRETNSNDELAVFWMTLGTATVNQYYIFNSQSVSHIFEPVEQLSQLFELQESSVPGAVSPP